MNASITVAVALAVLAGEGVATAQTARDVFRKVVPSVVVIRSSGRDVAASGPTRFGETGAGVLDPGRPGDDGRPRRPCRWTRSRWSSSAGRRCRLAGRLGARRRSLAPPARSRAGGDQVARLADSTRCGWGTR